MGGSNFTFTALISGITAVHDRMRQTAGQAVNMSLTIRNWVIGEHIREYEIGGADRAEYGQNLIDNLAEALQADLDKSYTGRYLRLCRQFYDLYPQIRKSLISKSDYSSIRKSLISKSAPAHVDTPANGSIELAIDGGRLVENLNFTHFVELIKIHDDLKRVFYEFECIRGNWTVRELKRQIGSLYYERSALSKDKEKLKELVAQGAETRITGVNIRDPYVFDFLGLNPDEVMSESLMEQSLINKLQRFLLELGHGFCFEARQKRIRIGDSQYFVDLVFYHRILKCHVLIELKLGEFNHENIGQLNTYVSWYKKNEMTEGDNPPVGILLCSDRDRALVDYALAGMDNQLFVSKYQIQLPDKSQMEQFLLKEMAQESDNGR